jgi:hypothetical protein
MRRFAASPTICKPPNSPTTLLRLPPWPERRCALMCAEAVPWRCHRSLVADALVVRGIAVEHIVSAHQRKAHTLTPFARVMGTRITYPPPEGQA